MLRNLATQGHSIIFISHKLNEVLEIADRITVIRRERSSESESQPRPTRATSRS